MRFVHSSGVVAVQMRISSSITSWMARCCGVTITPALYCEPTNSAK